MMCGIFCLIQQSERKCSISDFSFHSDLSRRGPDHYGWICPACSAASTGPHVEKDTTTSPLFAHIASTVLHIRGKEVTRQPVSDHDGNILAWNGEVFECSNPAKLDCSSSDTSYVSESLGDCDGDRDIWRFFSQFDGPFAFVFLHRASNLLYFGRDQLGRRSLLWSQLDGVLTLSSVFVPKEDPSLGEIEAFVKPSFGEVPASGLFRIALHGKLKLVLFPWIRLWPFAPETDADFQLFKSHNELGVQFCDPGYEKHAQADNPLSDPCRSIADLRSSIADLAASPLLLLKQLLNIPVVFSLVCDFEDFLRKSIERRLKNPVPCCKSCTGTCIHAKVAILFSGGIDSMVMTCLALDIATPDSPVDLLNVSFVTDNKPEDAEKAPDRITGQHGFDVLAEKFSRYELNFVRINVIKSEADHARKTRLWRLILPQDSVLDASLSTALWFAARGEGFISKGTENTPVPYTSPARVLFSGLGADELLGGYSRHRTRFAQGGIPALEEELSVDLRRISSRNCGRDDRIIADHGREVRYPYLDEDVVMFLSSLPVLAKCDLSLKRGIGEKLLLRLLAVKLGLNDVAVLEKRAMQFGTRIAKIDQTKNGFAVSSVLREARENCADHG